MSNQARGLRLPTMDDTERYAKHGGRSHLDALRYRELTPGYRLLTLLRGRTPMTVCSAALTGGGVEESITTLVLSQMQIDGVDDAEVAASVDRILATYDLHPMFADSGPVPALTAVWAGIALIQTGGQSSAIPVCQIAKDMYESDALARIVQNDFELRPVSGKSGWAVVEKAGLWDETFDLMNSALRGGTWADGGRVNRDTLLRILTGFTSVVQNVADEISDGMFDGLPQDWVKDTVTDIIEDLREQFDT